MSELALSDEELLMYNSITIVALLAAGFIALAFYFGWQSQEEGDRKNSLFCALCIVATAFVEFYAFMNYHETCFQWVEEILSIGWPLLPVMILVICQYLGLDLYRKGLLERAHTEPTIFPMIVGAGIVLAIILAFRYLGLPTTTSHVFGGLLFVVFVACLLWMLAVNIKRQGKIYGTAFSVVAFFSVSAMLMYIYFAYLWFWAEA